MTARIGLSLGLGCECPKPISRLGKVCRKAPPRLHRARKIVMLVADVWRRMLEHPWDQANLLRRVHRQEGGCRSTEVVKTHRLPELGNRPRTSNVVQSVPAQGASVT